MSVNMYISTTPFRTHKHLIPHKDQNPATAEFCVAPCVSTGYQSSKFKVEGYNHLKSPLQYTQGLQLRQNKQYLLMSACSIHPSP